MSDEHDVGIKNVVFIRIIDPYTDRVIAGFRETLSFAPDNVFTTEWAMQVKLVWVCLQFDSWHLVFLCWMWLLAIAGKRADDVEQFINQ
jgi:hypothetical protein